MFGATTVAQTPWTLDACIKYAFDNNIVLKQQQLQTEGSKVALTQSKLSVLPNLNAGAGVNYNYGRIYNPYVSALNDNNTKYASFNVSSSITLFNGLQTWNTIKQNEFNLMAILYSNEKTKNDLMLNIATAYLQILFAQEMLQNTKSQIQVTQEQEKRTEKLVDAGSMPRGSLLQIQSQLATEELNVINADNNLKTATLVLVQLLELKDAANFKIVYPVINEPDQSNLSATVDQIFQEAQKLPQVKSAEFQVKSADKGLSIAKGRRSPSLSFTAVLSTVYSPDQQKPSALPYPDWLPVLIGNTQNTKEAVYSLPQPTFSYSNYVFGQQFSDNINKSFSFNLSIPIFNKWTTNTAISNAKGNLQNQKYVYQQTQNQLYKDIQQAYNDALAALAKYNGTKKALTSQEEAFKYVQQKFDLGLVNTIDYNTEKTKLSATQSDLLQAKYEFVFKCNVLNLYRGLPIKL